MKTLKLLLGLTLTTTLFTSCYTEVVIDEVIDDSISINQLLNSYELWYVDINATEGFGETPFLQKAFTISFRSGVLYANNNLVGIGSQGGGFGIPIGDYSAYDMILDVDHDLDGFDSFDVFQVDNNTIELYNPFNDTSYFLEGHNRNTFDYDFVFYDNIHYFLQEYEAWEKTYTSEMGVLNEFDNENYLQFLAGGNDSEFRSSQDEGISDPLDILWDYTGVYGVGDVSGDMYLKTLILDYEFFENEYFELSVLNDAKIELFHPASETIYEFEGRGYIEYLRSANSKDSKPSTDNSNKKRKQYTPKKENLRENTRT